MLTLVASALAGGDCIDDATCCHRGNRPDPGLRSQGAIQTFLRSFRWGHVRQLDRQPQLLARAVGWGRTRRRAIHHDLDSTICETYGLAKEGARDHGYTGLLAVAAGTGDG